MLTYKLFELFNTSYTYTLLKNNSDCIIYTFNSETDNDLFVVRLIKCTDENINAEPYLQKYKDTYIELCNKFNIIPNFDILWCWGWWNNTKGEFYSDTARLDFLKLFSTSISILKNEMLDNNKIICYKGVDYETPDPTKKYLGISKKDRIYVSALKNIQNYKLIQSDWNNMYITYIIPNQYLHTGSAV